MRRTAGDSFLWSAVKILFLPGVIISVFLMIWLRTGITSLEYRVSELEAKKLKLMKEKKELLVSRSDMLSIRNVERVAMGRLGLTFPDRKKVIYVKTDEQPYQYRADYTGQSK
jgi:cell division protein FtsL